MKINRKKELGDFLKNKRESLSPESFGIVTKSKRRACGLRREEVAELAGVGISWYTWLEQGRDIQVSYPLLSSILIALKCSYTETKYVLELAGYSSTNASNSLEQSSMYSLRYILDSLEIAPTIVLDSHWNIIAWNKMASYVYDVHNNLQYNNLIELIFLDKNYQILFPNWKDKAQELLAQFRLSFSKEIENEALIYFIASMKERSSFFDECWNEHRVIDESPFSKTILHPLLNELSFDFSSLHYIDESMENLKIFINVPSNDGITEDKLKQISI
ncbi:helix-turn-helix transcriptional regulator [Listeria seeligeri]|uniref:helix-turn-helix transcriptional regulator n=1 Tax=Listeria seeligeri TaxID=1640 RepID=UPI0022EC01A6|nr:helix-turn-helix transcriptional regulator [Listeria seeligeri]